MNKNIGLEKQNQYPRPAIGCQANLPPKVRSPAVCIAIHREQRSNILRISFIFGHFTTAMDPVPQSRIQPDQDRARTSLSP